MLHVVAKSDVLKSELLTTIYLHPKFREEKLKSEQRQKIGEFLVYQKSIFEPIFDYDNKKHFFARNDLRNPLIGEKFKMLLKVLFSLRIKWPLGGDKDQRGG